MHLPTSPIQLLIIAVVVVVLFGRGKVSSLMGEIGRGITQFKKGMSDSSAEAEAPVAPPAAALPAVAPVTATAPAETAPVAKA